MDTENYNDYNSVQSSYTTLSHDTNLNSNINIKEDNLDNEENVFSLYSRQAKDFLRLHNSNRGGSAQVAKSKTHWITNNPRCRSAKQPSTVPVNVESVLKLKDSTRKLLRLLDEIQSKTRSKNLFPDDNFKELPREHLRKSAGHPTVTEVIGENALRRLEQQAKILDDIYIEEEEDDCSIYKKLTRKCNCLNADCYNDFVIHFNEDTNFNTSYMGELIKNLRILKKFLYMGGHYTKRALMFLNEGLSDSSHTEKIEIIQGCTHSDICNVFEDKSIVIICISWPCTSNYYGDTTTQNLATEFLYKLSQFEEGRRYLKFSTKITNDIKKVLRKKASKLDPDVIDMLNTTLNLMNPFNAPVTKFMNMTYHSKPIVEGYGNQTVTALSQYREAMTLEEVFTHLDLLLNMSKQESGKKELTSILPTVMVLFKNLLVEFDNSEINIILTNILNNIVSKSMSADEMDIDGKKPKTVVMMHTATEPIIMKNELIQMPPKKNHKTANKSKSRCGMSPSKLKQLSKHKGPDNINSGWEISQAALNRSRKFISNNSLGSIKQELRNSVIIVPIDKLK